jgi:hypothetical protein
VIKDRAAFTERAGRLVSFADIVKISKADMEYLYPGLSLEAGIEKILSTTPPARPNLLFVRSANTGRRLR